MDAKKLTKTGWSVSAGMGRSTVARALDMDAPHIPTTLTLIKLAKTAGVRPPLDLGARSEEHTSELQSLMRISYAVFCLKKKKRLKIQITTLIYNYRILAYTNT